MPANVNNPRGQAQPTTYFLPDELTLLGLRRLPAILNRWHVSVLLGIDEERIGSLVEKGLLRALGQPCQGRPFRFMRDQVLEFGKAPQKLRAVFRNE